MTAIWQNDGTSWRLLSPSGFPAEAALHELVERAPHILPLAGSPHLIVVGREVGLGGNSADLIAIEPSGRLAIIEIKLARNAEARRAVIAQVLTYAAHLRGLDVATLEHGILGNHLRQRGYDGLGGAVAANDQEGSFEAAAFASELALNLEEGRFRLVLVLDDAPAELVRLVGYLEAAADKLRIDLITVAAYEIGGSQVVVPQRVEPEERRATGTVTAHTPRPTTGGRFVEGAADFETAIDDAPEGQRPLLRRMTEWAMGLEREGLVNLGTYHGKSGLITLLPRLPADDVGLVTVYNHRSSDGAYLQFWRSVIVRRAPSSLPSIEELAAPAKVGQGTTTRTVSEDLLQALADGYREAAEGRLQLVEQPTEPESGALLAR